MKKDQITQDGRIILWDNKTQFIPVNHADEKFMANINSCSIPMQIQFDGFNKSLESPEFFGYLDMVFSGIGNWLFADYRVDSKGKPHAKITSYTMEGVKFDSDQIREQIVEIAIFANALHDRNSNEEPSTTNGWKKIKKTLSGRVDPNQAPYSMTFDEKNRKNTRMMEKNSPEIRMSLDDNFFSNKSMSDIKS